MSEYPNPPPGTAMRESPDLASLRAEVERLNEYAASLGAEWSKKCREAERERDGWRGSYMGATGTIGRLAAALRRLLGWVEDLHDDDSCISEARAALAEVEP